MNPTPGSPIDRDDLMLDQNLRTLGPALHVPPAPTAEQIDAWRTPASGEGDAGAGARGTLAFPRRRAIGAAVRSRWLAVGSAAAAVIAVAGVILTTTASSRVHAGTIVQSLRRAVISGIDISLDNVVTKEATVRGQLRVRFREPLNLEALIDESDASRPTPMPSAIHGSLDFTARLPALEGLTFHLESAITTESSWAFIRTGEIPPEVVGDNLPAAFIANFVRSGVVLDLGTDGLNFLNQDHGGNTDAKREKHEKRGVRIGVGGDGAGEHTHQLSAPAEAAVRTMITGRAGPAELAQVADLLEQSAADAEVQNLGGGRYMLVATCPPKSGVGHIRIAYTQNEGVRWAEFSGGPGRAVSGTVRIELVNDPIPADLLDRQRVMGPGVATFTIDQIKRMFGG